MKRGAERILRNGGDLSDGDRHNRCTVLDFLVREEFPFVNPANEMRYRIEYRRYGIAGRHQALKRKRNTHPTGIQQSRDCISNPE